MKFLIVGLGNIGDEYVDTRHNIGFIAVDALALSFKATFEPGRYASIARISVKGRQLVVIKPTTYMNLSGKAVRYWMQKEDIPKENILVIVDDLALPIGTLRLRAKGSDGGHNGLISIIETIGTTEFARLRIGIGNDFAKGYQIDYVLGRWTKEEEKTLLPRIETTVELIKSFALIGVERTMNFFNTKGK
ncbi:MAG: aminoacyl-tRNA hydrolase [Bacteroidales bacterium]|nr:aminoacyl-tRNA hydrolase [Bacteroidales bacterium]